MWERYSCERDINVREVLMWDVNVREILMWERY